MQFAYNNPQLFKRQRWQAVWPTTLLALIATGQMILTFLVVSFETWSMILNFKYSFVTVGYEAAFFFTITWISTFTVVCCNRGSQGCATHALVENVLSVIASSVLLYYDALFLRQPFRCFWPRDICGFIGVDDYWNLWEHGYNFDTQRYKLIAIKLQLSCAAIMLFLNVLFIGIYIYTSCKVKNRPQLIHPQATVGIDLQQVSAPTPYPVWATQPPLYMPPPPPPPTNV